MDAVPLETDIRIPRRSTRANVGLFVLQMLPVVGYAAICIVSILHEKVLYFGRLDVAISLGVLGYMGLVILAGRKRSWTLGLLILTYSSLAALGVFEAAMLYRFPLPTVRVPWPPIHRVSQAADTMPGNTGTIEFTTNNLGLRGPYMVLNKRALSILCVGGSTTACEYVTDELTWPWLVQRKLSRRLGTRVLVGNAGRPGQFSLHHEFQLRHYFAAPLFDWVVMLCGINDASLALIGRQAADMRRHNVPNGALMLPFPPNRAYYHMAATLRCIERLVQVSLSQAVLHDDAGRWLAVVRERRRALLKSGPPRQPSPERIQAELSMYHDTLTRIAQICKRRGQKLVMMTQPTMWQANMPEALGKLLWQHAGGAYPTDFLVKHIGRYNQVMKDVCGHEGVYCIDLASMLPQDTSVFYDDCHFNISGCEKVADILTDFIATRSEAERPLGVP